MSVAAHADSAPSVGNFTILTVCTGNVCRSPLAASLLRVTLVGLPIDVRSAGTAALVGRQMTEPNQRIAASLGATDAARHRATQLTRSHLSEADLVLALSREHRREVVELLPVASQYTFTLRECARLAQALPDSAHASWERLPDPRSRLLAAVHALARSRGGAPPIIDAAAEDVTDPFRQSEAVYYEQASQIIPAINAIVALLGDAVDGRS